MCGMTRAMITDPEMANKAMAGRLDDIRACIGCNQSCIGRFQKGLSISCIQNPVTGRELRFGNPPPVKSARKVLVVGGGLAGMKAAVIARQRGHEVTLIEASRSLGGQAQLAQLLPERSEFGGSITNLLREIEREQIPVELNTAVDRQMIAERSPDVVILATGAVPYTPVYEQMGDMEVVQAVDVLRNEAKVGKSVVIVDWRSDWVGTGVALRLAQNGHRVRLAVNGTVASETIQNYVRDHNNGQLHKHGVEVIPFAQLFGVDDSNVYLQHSVTREAIIIEEVDTVVLASAVRAVDGLADELADFAGDLHLIGDCLTPRTAEEAIYEGFVTAMAL